MPGLPTGKLKNISDSQRCKFLQRPTDLSVEVTHWCMESYSSTSVPTIFLKLCQFVVLVYAFPIAYNMPSDITSETFGSHN